MGDWFEALFGFTEENKAGVHEFLQVKGPQMHSLVNDAKFTIGTFSTPSLAELRTRGQKNLAKLPGQLRLSVLKGDVSAFMADDANRHAVFQVASQFNCLEFPGPRTTPEQGVTGYVFDRTQGPCCSIACGAGTVYRNYFVPIPVTSQTTQIGQSKVHQLNNLKEVSSYLGNEDGVVTRSPRRKKYMYFDHSAGYTMATREGLEALNSKLQSIGQKGVEKAKSLLRIGLQADVQVTSKNWGKEQLRKKAQTVSQVFGSACSVAYSEGSSRMWAPFASLVLDASYEATFWVALETAVRHASSGGSNKLFLTLLGGGVFGNRFEWIADAIGKAARKFANTGLDVRIVFYGPVCDEIKTMINEYNEWLVTAEESDEKGGKKEEEVEEEVVEEEKAMATPKKTRGRAKEVEPEKEEATKPKAKAKEVQQEKEEATKPKAKTKEVEQEKEATTKTKVLTEVVEEEEVIALESDEEVFLSSTTAVSSKVTTRTPNKKKAESEEDDDSWTKVEVVAATAEDYVELTTVIASSISTSTLRASTRAAAAAAARLLAEAKAKDDMPLAPRATRSRSPHPSTRSRSPHPSTRSPKSAPTTALSPDKLTYGKRRAVAAAQRTSPRKTTRKI